MPSKSKAQQRFMGMVRATQKGEMKNPSPEISRAAASMKKKDVKDFASTKHEGLPEKKEEKEARTKVAVYMVKQAQRHSQAKTFRYLNKVAQRFYRGEPLLASLQAEFPHLSKEAAYKVAQYLIEEGLKAGSCAKPGCPPQLPHPQPKAKKKLKKAMIGVAGGQGQNNAPASYAAAPSVSTTATGPGMSSALNSMGGTSALGGLATMGKQANLAALLRKLLAGGSGRMLAGSAKDLIGRNQMAIGGGLAAGGAAGGKLLWNKLMGKQSDFLDSAAGFADAVVSAPAKSLKTLRAAGARTGEDYFNRQLEKTKPTPTAAANNDVLAANKALYSQPDSAGHRANRLESLVQRLGQESYDANAELRRRRGTPISVLGGYVNQGNLDDAADSAQAAAQAGAQGGLLQNPQVQAALLTGGSLIGAHALWKMMQRRREEEQRAAMPPMGMYPPQMYGGGPGQRALFF